MVRNSLSIFLLLLVLVAAAQAGIIYNNGGPDEENGFSIMSPAISAADFTLASGASIYGVGFYFQNYNGIAGWNQDIAYALFSNNAGVPGALLASGPGQNLTVVDSGLPWCCGGGNAYLVTFDLVSPFSAQAGVTYWLGLGGATGGNAAWWVTTNLNSAYSAVVSSGEGDWQSIEYDLAFYLTDTAHGSAVIPEPGSMALLGLGLAGLAALRRRQRRG